MTESDWVELMAKRLRAATPFRSGHLKVMTGHRLAYGHEISGYGRDGLPITRMTFFETDLAIVEQTRDGNSWPRVVVEAKIKSVSTHDAITYSAKAGAHRSVYPYLRYGIMLGKRGHFPLPWRLYSHGAMFDFMISFRAFRPSEVETNQFLRLLKSEIQASRTLQKILFESRKRDRDRYTVLHRKLEVSP